MTTWLTTEEVAELLHAKPATIARNCAAGKIPAARVGGRWLIAEAVIKQMLQPANIDRADAERVTSTVGRRAS